MRRLGREPAAAVRLLLLVCFASFEAFPQFQISESRLLHDGEPFVVRGVVYANAPIGAPAPEAMSASECLYPRDFPLIAGLGANTIRTRERVSPADHVFRRSLESAGLYWIAGFPLASYGDLAHGAERALILEDLSAYLAGWEDEPRLLAVQFGEDGAGDSPEFFSLLNEAAARIHAEHPGLLVTAGVRDVREIGAFDRASQDFLLPALDFWSFEASGWFALWPLVEEVAARTAKPMLVSGFGIDAFDDGIGAADLEVQAQHAGALAEEIEAILQVGPGGVLGGVYAEFADQWHRGGPDAGVHGAAGRAAAASPDGVFNEAWAGLFGLARSGAAGLDSLRARPAYQELARVWGGPAPPELSLADPPELLDGLRNGASGMSVLAPGALVEAPGEGLAAASWQAAPPADLPFHLGATSLCIDGAASPLYLAEPGLVRGLTPWSARTGPRQALVYRAGVASRPATIEVREAAPGILPNGVFRPGLPCPVNEANGVPPGTYLEVYGTGLGAATTPQQNGVAPSAPLAAAAMPEARIGPYAIPVVYSGLFPGAPGVYQTNVRIPVEAGAGPVDLRLSLGGTLSNAHALRVLSDEDEPGAALAAPSVEEVVVQESGPAQTVYLDMEGFNGFCSLVRFEVSGLPQGVRASIPVGLPGQRIPLTLWAEAGAARVESAPVTVTAVSTLRERPARTVRVTVLPGSGDVRLRVVSGGWLSGAPEASFMLEDRVLYKAQGGGPGRGFNFLTIHPQTGVVGEVRQFDTWGNEEAVAAMESYLRGLPEGAVVLGAIADDGTLKITEQTRELIRERLGSELIGLVEYQWSWAVIARVGAERPIAEGMMPNGTVVLDRVVSFPLP